MSYLIEDLKKEHNLMREILSEVKKSGIGSKESRNKLLAAKKGLLGHLKKEDDMFYPSLIEAAKNDEVLKQELKVLKKDLQETSRLVSSFFEKYSKEGALSLDFARDFGEILARLGFRMKKEEKIFYNAYDRLIK